MAVTTDPYAASDLAPRIPEVWSSMILEELFPKTVAANWFRDYSDDVASEGDIINIADIYTNSFSVSTQSTQGAEITTESVAQANVQLTVDTHEYIAFIIGDKDYRQLLSDFDFASVYTRKAAGTLKDSIEDSLFALWSGLSTNSVGDTGTVLTDLELRQSVEKLHALNFPLGEAAWMFHTFVYWNQVAGIQKLYDASMRGRGDSVTVDGNFGDMSESESYFGMLYGSPIFVTPNVVSGLQTYRNLYAHKDAFGFANQTPTISGGNGCRVQMDYELRNLGMLSVIDVLYGVTEVRDQAAVLVNANTTATTA